MHQPALPVPAQRFPHAGHVLLLCALLAVAFVVCLLPLLIRTRTPPTAYEALLAQAGAYGLTLSAAWLVFPLLWKRPFVAGIAWNAGAVRWSFAALGLAVGFASQGIETLLPVPPRTLPIETLFKTPGLIWPLAFFGVLLGPLFEEVVFRGFLLPACAIAVDWMRLPRRGDPLRALATLDTWRAGDVLSASALLAGSLVTSFLFALVHAPQIGFSGPHLALLMTVSLVLCWVRLRWRSVAASTLVHACYNLSVFLSLFVSTGGFRHLDKL